MGLYVDGNEYNKAFDEAVQMFATPGELRYMLVTLYHQGADVVEIIQKHEAVPLSDVPLDSAEERV